MNIESYVLQQYEPDRPPLITRIALCPGPKVGEDCEDVFWTFSLTFGDESYFFHKGYDAQGTYDIRSTAYMLESVAASEAAFQRTTVGNCLVGVFLSAWLVDLDVLARNDRTGVCTCYIVPLNPPVQMTPILLHIDAVELALYARWLRETFERFQILSGQLAGLGGA